MTSKKQRLKCYQAQRLATSTFTVTLFIRPGQTRRSAQGVELTIGFSIEILRLDGRRDCIGRDVVAGIRIPWVRVGSSAQPSAAALGTQVESDAESLGLSGQ